MVIDLIMRSFIYGMLIGGLWSLIALGFSLVFGVSGICNFAHGELFTIGGYTAFFVYSATGNFPITIVASAFVGFLGGVCIEMGLIRPIRKKMISGWQESAMTISLGLSILLQNCFLATLGSSFKSKSYFPQGMSILGVSFSIERGVAFLVAVLFLLAIWLFLNRTKFGKAIGAVTQDSVAARLMGVDTDFVHIAVFGISGVAAAVAGGLMLPVTMVYPTVGFHNALLMSFIVVIIGGLGEVKGIIFVGIIMGIIESVVTAFFLSEYATLVSFAILITILVLKPEGLFGRRE